MKDYDGKGPTTREHFFLQCNLGTVMTKDQLLENSFFLQCNLGTMMMMTKDRLLENSFLYSVI